MGSLWNRSGTIERYADDIRAAGAKAYFFQGGTTTPLTVYQDGGEASVHTHPVVADNHGRWPDIFVPYTLSYDVQVKTAEGVQLTFSLAIPNPDPVELTVTSPAENQVQTGMIHGELVNTSRTGYVRLNGRTIGNGSSSGTERANDDTEDLFLYLSANLNDTIAPVSGGRTTGAADFAANKTIVLPSFQGTLMGGLDDMGNSAAGNFQSLSFVVGDVTTAGSLIGDNETVIEEGQLPSHAHTGSSSVDGDHTHTGSASGTTNNDSGHTHTWGDTFTTDGQSQSHTHSYNNTNNSGGGTSGGGTVAATAGTAQTGTTSQDHTHTGSVGGTTDPGPHQHPFTGTVSLDTEGDHSHTFTTDSVGDGDLFNNMPLTRLVTWYIKL